MDTATPDNKSLWVAKTKRCRHCAEEILADAKVCKHCGRSDKQRPGYPVANTIISTLALLFIAVLVAVVGFIVWVSSQ